MLIDSGRSSSGDGPITFVACLILVLGLTLPDLLDAQDIARLQSGVVKGFIVRLEKDVAYIVTSTHVVAGDSEPKVEFFTKKNLSVPGEVLGLEGGDEIRCMALLVVKGQENYRTGSRRFRLGQRSLQ